MDASKMKDDLKVEYFYGERSKLGMYLIQLKAVFTLQRAKYNTHPDRVLFAGLQLRGSAFEWFEPIMGDYLGSATGQRNEETNAIFGNFAVFEERIKQVFGIPEEELAASQRIHQLKQTRSAAKYYTIFQRLTSKLNWEDKAFTSAYYQSLKNTVKDRIGVDRPNEYKPLVKYSIETDN
jgi:hypothetical protein